MALEDRLASEACPAPEGGMGEMRPRGKVLALSLPHTGTWAPSESGCHAAVFIQEEPGGEQECASSGCGLSCTCLDGRPWPRPPKLGQGQGRPGG